MWSGLTDYELAKLRQVIWRASWHTPHRALGQELADICEALDIEIDSR